MRTWRPCWPPRRDCAPPHRVATYRTLIGLLVVTGMRVGEAIALDLRDFDAEQGLITVRQGKLGKSRALPLHPHRHHRGPAVSPPRRPTGAPAHRRVVRVHRLVVAT